MSCVPATHAQQFVRLSWLSCLSSLYGFYRGYYDLALVPGGVWLTSYIYWTKNDYSIWRYIDIVYVNIGLGYSLYRATASSNKELYFLIKLIAILFFIGAVYTSKKQLLDESFYLHCLLHIVGNIGNIVLYSGHFT
tara:strand:- start:3152 stop:3559 length:408 start_codon:yes stop_codon:yes gene_type:complete